MAENEKTTPIMDVQSKVTNAFGKGAILQEMDKDGDARVTKDEIDGFEKGIEANGMIIKPEVQAEINQTKADITSIVDDSGSVSTSFYSDLYSEALKLRDMNTDGFLVLEEIKAPITSNPSIANGNVGVLKLDEAIELLSKMPMTRLQGKFPIKDKTTVTFDANGDGNISIEEVGEFKQTLADNGIEIKGFDADKLTQQIKQVGQNGVAKIEDIAKIDEVQFKEAAEALRKMDANQDGYLSPNEITANQTAKEGRNQGVS